jgi:pimeloyl-ACP methyl ester carboxylesterase
MSRAEITVAHYRGFGYDCRTLVNPDPDLPPVVLVGGAFQQKTAWGRFEALLAEAASVVTVDLPGWGGSDLLPARYGMDFLAEALHHVLVLAGHRRVHVFGGSYGGAVALRLAQLYPEQVLDVALMGTPARIPETLAARLMRTVFLLRAGRMDEFADYSVSLLLTDDRSARVARNAAVRRILAGIFRGVDADAAAKFVENTMRLIRHDLHSANAPVTVPVLLGTGEYDDFTTPGLCRAVAEYCADARFTLLRNADHAVHLQVPEALAQLVLRFYAGECLDGLALCHPVETYGVPARARDAAASAAEQPAGAWR